MLVGGSNYSSVTVKSKWAEQLGYKTSWFDYLSSKDLYQSKRKTPRFNEIYVTKLTRKYKLHAETTNDIAPVSIDKPSQVNAATEQLWKESEKRALKRKWDCQATSSIDINKSLPVTTPRIDTPAQSNAAIEFPPKENENQLFVWKLNVQATHSSNINKDVPVDHSAGRGSFDAKSTDDSSDDVDDALTYEGLFASGSNTNDSLQQYEYEYVMGADDSFEVLNTADCETTTITISFCISNESLVASTTHDGEHYSIGHLDLNDEERLVLDQAIKSTVFDERNPSITVDRNDVVIENGSLSIQRIECRPNTNDSTNNNFSKLLNTKRIQFSDSNPLLAKYEDNIYFIGDELRTEYMELLQHTEKPIGTAIQMNVNRITIDRHKRILDIFDAQSYHDEGIFVYSTSAAYNNNLLEILNEFSEGNKYRRWMISSDPFDIAEVKPNLMHSSQSDSCTEIYAVLGWDRFAARLNNSAKIQRYAESVDSDGEYTDSEESDDSEAPRTSNKKSSRKEKKKSKKQRRKDRVSKKKKSKNSDDEDK